MWRRSRPNICAWPGRRLARLPPEAPTRRRILSTKKTGRLVRPPGMTSEYRVPGYLTNTEMLTLTVWPPGP